MEALGSAIFAFPSTKLVLVGMPRPSALPEPDVWVPHHHTVPAALPKMVGTHSLHLKHLALVAREDFISGPHGSETIRKTVLGRLPPQGHCRQETNTHPQSSCEKGLFTCPEASVWGAHFRTTTHLEAMEALSQNVRQGNAIFVLFLGLTTACHYLPQRSPYTHLEPQFLQVSLRG